MKVGIDKIGFYSPDKYIDMVDLANARNEDPNKYLIGIGQKKQAVIPNTQDVVTMAANASQKIINDDDKKSIDLIIFGTETGVDNSKSAAIYLQNLLKLNASARAFEIKQACYGATAGLQMAKEYVTNHPNKKALVIGADVARYGLNTPGEVTQGGGAIAMVVSTNPSIASFDGESAFHSDDIMDFWRPLYRTEAVVDGHYSNNVYVDFFKDTWDKYNQMNQLSVDDYKALAFHLPYVKMGIKGLRAVLPEASESKQEELKNEFNFSKIYSENIGNLYTGSLYLSFLSLINNSNDLQIGDRIGLFSYGSGAQGEFFSMKLEQNFKNNDSVEDINSMLNNREKLTIDEYEKMFNNWIPIKNVNMNLNWQSDDAEFFLKALKDNQRIYDHK
ncbi:hydroxymethylglutaryl-CoA synthase [Apilactobacillus timberlakei]|uniref:Hydroxymethylglutaryl-CoA synthase n=1 Tax=Apilactobacillus timberlakei TaxID=2008380 RepID=A0ABY2YXJ2_9LACO|nr:hydroxymethylglutaryl-CoA synthase [Apilactobacillus timberlakei]TPR13813.1 hydroxymethylglutaryl-CoA synthase [Apilactobacillus timberlakei]TPR15128.1 hydroxymethylglutaryl-CoA synthase [Apilactobacillus timberlakei]TPR17020.1 hydroxymethylglutaryl-CoA synthase [Apilactobacillus timberlakei]